MLRTAFLILLLFVFALGSAQLVPGHNGKPFVFPYENGFKFIDKDYEYYTEDGKNFLLEEHNFDLEEYRFLSVRGSERIVLVAAGGGQVLEYSEGELERVDKSFLFNSRYGAFNFIKGDTLFSVGGSGEFNVQNNIIYFTEGVREWLVESRYQPRTMGNKIPFGQYASESNKVYFNASNAHHLEGKDQFEVQNDFATAIYSYDFSSKRIQEEYDLDPIFRKFFSNPLQPVLQVFNGYKLPILYTTKELFTFNIQFGKAYRYSNADFNTLIQYSKILSYNERTNDFLLVFGDNDYSKYLVIDETLLLGNSYEEFALKRSRAEWGFLWYLAPLLFLPFLIRKKRISLIQGVNNVEPELRKKLSSEEYKIYEIIKEAYPNGVEYPDLQAAFERELSYESRIKKLRTTIVSIDKIIQKLLNRKGNSVFTITKGKEDKRVKVIRFKEDEVFKIWWKNKKSLK